MRISARIVLFALCAANLADLTFAADVFKSKDAQGHLVYSDKRPTATAERMTIEPGPRNKAESLARTDSQRVAYEAAAAERIQRNRTEAAKRAAAQDQRATRCKEALAQKAYFGFDSPKFRVDASGNRIYYSVAEIDQKRTEAKQQIAELCPRTPR